MLYIFSMSSTNYYRKIERTGTNMQAYAWYTGKAP
jgi:hypothetical protein